MIFRRAYLTIAAAAAALTVASLPAVAAMPVAGALPLADDGLVIQIAQKRKSAKKKSELDRSIDQGTVPARYRSRVPREYQQYIPFEKRR